MRRSGRLTTPVGHQPHDHLCWAYEEQGTWCDVAVPYLHDGAAARDRVLYVAGGTEDDLADDLAALPERDAMLASGQLRVRPVAAAFGPEAEFSATRQVASFRDEARTAVRDGYRGLRLAVEASELADGPDAARGLAGYELLLDTMIATAPMSSLCGYRRSRVAPGVADLLCFVHPLRHSGIPALDGAGLFAARNGRWRLCGAQDLVNQEALDAALAALPVTRDVHLELDGLEFIGAAGIRALAALAARLAPAHRLVLHDPPPLVARVLRAGWADAPGLAVETS